MDTLVSLAENGPFTIVLEPAPQWHDFVRNDRQTTGGEHRLSRFDTSGQTYLRFYTHSNPERCRTVTKDNQEEQEFYTHSNPERCRTDNFALFTQYVFYTHSNPERCRIGKFKCYFGFCTHSNPEMCGKRRRTFASF